MVILGINGGVRPGYHDVAAVLVVDGVLVAAVEEERLNRIKSSPGQLPEKAIEHVLEIHNISIKDVDVVASHGITWGDEYQDKLEEYFRFRFGHAPKIERVNHHDAHAASAYYASGFDKAIVVSVDGSGDGISTQLSVGTGQQLENRKTQSRPNSLGIFYSMFTQFCGFDRDGDEYKLMGMSSYGKPTYDISDILSYRDKGFSLNEEFLVKIPEGGSQPSRQLPMYGDLESFFGVPRRRPFEKITSEYQNIAASAQHKLEEVMVQMVTDFYEEEKIGNLCLAGGVALNCVANQKLMNLPFIDQIYVQPASSDAGVSIGAAYLIAAKYDDTIQPMENAYLGAQYTDDHIESDLKTLKVNYTKISNPAEEAAKLVADGNVVGWFQGREEFGPRALGNRSILASPSIEGMDKTVNQKIKFRESFRPFCPSVLEEDAPLYFEGKQSIAPYMTITYDVKEEMRDQIPAVTHVDGTARIQTVNEKQNSLYYQYLKALKQLTGHGVTLNTSFNVKDEPIVSDPKDAIRTFFGSGLDALIIGNFLIVK